MDTGAQNAVIGDVADVTELPATKIQDEDLQNEKNLAKFSKTKEFYRSTSRAVSSSSRHRCPMDSH
jgi:hypothetical protein